MKYAEESESKRSVRNSSKTLEMEMDRSRSTHGTKLKPTCGTDLDTKWEKEARTAEVDMEEDSGKGTHWDVIYVMGLSYSRGQTQGQLEATHFWHYPPLGGKKLN